MSPLKDIHISRFLDSLTCPLPYEIFLFILIATLLARCEESKFILTQLILGTCSPVWISAFCRVCTPSHQQWLCLQKFVVSNNLLKIESKLKEFFLSSFQLNLTSQNFYNSKIVHKKFQNNFFLKILIDILEFLVHTKFLIYRNF